MRSTEIALLTLRYRRAEVAAFWTLATVVLCLLIAGIAAIAGAPSRWGAAGLGVLLPGVFTPAWFDLGVRAWNKITLVTAHLLSAYVTRVSYYVLFGALAGAAFRRPVVSATGADTSRWVARLQHDVRSRLLASERHERQLGAFPADRAHLWAFSLAPALLLLKLLGDEREPDGPPSGTYTLY
jgi:hypothetical protein